MPYGKRKFRKKGRRVARRRRKARLPKKLAMFKSRRLVRMRYVERIALNPGIASLATHIFSANGLYDPNITGTGHQPLSFDQLVGVFYSHYTVIAAKIKCTFNSATSTPSSSLAHVGVLLDRGTSTITNIDTMIEQGRAKTRILTSSDAKGYAIVSQGVNMNKFLGQKVLSEDDNAGSVAGNPAEQVYFHVFAGGVNDTTNPDNFNVLCEIDYLAYLHEPISLTGS